MSAAQQSQKSFTSQLKKVYTWYTGGFVVFVSVLAALEQMTREQPERRPSLRELMQATGMSSGGVQAALATLRDDYGYVEQAQAGGKCVERTIRLIPQTY